MKLGYIGVGKMGGPMAGRLIAAGHELVVFDAREAAVKPFVERGARAAASVAALARLSSGKLDRRRVRADLSAVNVTAR